MKKIVFALLLVTGLFINIASSTSTNIIHLANSNEILAEKKPIDGDH